MDITHIQQLVENRKYLVKLHAFQHALKQGFNEQNMVEAILSGKIIESYSERERVLICGQSVLLENVSIYLHIVCELKYDDQVEFVTAYIPDEQIWEWPPFRRRKKRI